MILADSSACIELLRAGGSVVHRAMRDLVASGEPVAITEPVAIRNRVPVLAADQDFDVIAEHTALRLAR